ncbi:MAG TPA: nucleotide exchange factor GrpE [Polyangiaceae bacterium]|nr:nucleotide exchange factor GrpE [Polyangiaceae bacterium]
MTSDFNSNKANDTTNPAGAGATSSAGAGGNGQAAESGQPAEAAVEVAPEESSEEKLRAEAARLKDQLLRLAADFDNFRKRSRREIQDAERMAREDLLRELLPVFDNLERASQHAGSATDVQSLVDGIGMVSRQFVDTLARLGVERIQSIGVAFDPAVHEAVQHLETADQPPGAVCAEVLPGYRFGDRLIRPAMVVVAKPSTSS